MRFIPFLFTALVATMAQASSPLMYFDGTHEGKLKSFETLTGSYDGRILSADGSSQECHVEISKSSSYLHKGAVVEIKTLIDGKTVKTKVDANSGCGLSLFKGNGYNCSLTAVKVNSFEAFEKIRIVNFGSNSNTVCQDLEMNYPYNEEADFGAEESAPSSSKGVK